MQDFTEFNKTIANMASYFPTDLSAASKAIKNTAEFNEKVSRVVLEAAEKNAEISSKWTRDTLARLSMVTQAKEDPTDYARAFNDFASESAESASEHFTALAEVAKKIQFDAVEIFLDAGKENQKETVEAIGKTAGEAVKAVKKATQVA